MTLPHPRRRLVPQNGEGSETRDGESGTGEDAEVVSVVVLPEKKHVSTGRPSSKGGGTNLDVTKEGTGELAEATATPEKRGVGHARVEETERERLEVEDDGELREDRRSVGEVDVELKQGTSAEVKSRERRERRTLKIVTEKSSSNPPSKASCSASPPHTHTDSNFVQISISSAASSTDGSVLARLRCSRCVARRRPAEM